MKISLRSTGFPTIRVKYAPGSTGPAGTVAVGTVTTGSAGSSAAITNSGTDTAAVLNFTIPRGDVGEPNTLTIGTVSTLSPGDSATATVTGTAPNQTLNLGLPQGIQGPSGSVTDGDKGDIVVSSSGTVWSIDSSVMTTAGRALMDDPNAAAQRATLGLVIGTDVQAYDASAVNLSIGDARYFRAPEPQGRLTLVSATPVLASTVSGAGLVYYTPYIGVKLPIRNKTSGDWGSVTFAELSNVLAASTSGNAGPSAAAAANVYDLYVWDTDGAGTLALTRSPAWSAGTGGSNTVRGTGSGGSALTRGSNGTLSNAVSITNGPAAGYGTYVGTIRTDVSGATVSFIPDVAGSAGGTAMIGLWNAYNRRPTGATVVNSNTSWTVLSNSPREPQGGPMRVEFVSGLAEDHCRASYQIFAQPASATNALCTIGVGLDSGTAFVKSALVLNSTSNLCYSSPIASHRSSPLLGAHFYAAIEAGDNVNNTTFYGGAGYGGLIVDLQF